MAAPQHHAAGMAEGVRPLPCPAFPSGLPGHGPRPFFVHWRSQRRQFFSYRARIVAWSAAEARARFLPRRGPEPVVVGVKAAAGWGSNTVAHAGRWVG
ncbi:hypothetical protein [Muricoccus radiodurans]|uniref:hypothetical protein n=1 Tax=Muricoccus radiodurans TaxID=2231721 RepID=UPI003CFA37D5